MFRIPHKLFEAEDASISGGEPTPLEKDVQELLGGVNIASAVEKAKALRDAAETPVELEKDPQEETPAGETATPDAKAETDSTSAESPLTNGAAQSIPLTAEQVAEMLGERDLKEVVEAFDNRESWNETFKQRSQANSFFNKLSPEQREMILPRILPYAYGQEEVPETPAALIEDMVKEVADLIPDDIAYEVVHDDETIPVRLPSDKIKPIINKIVGQVIKKAFPEMASVRNDYQALDSDYRQLQSQYSNLARTNGEIKLRAFAEKHPEIIPQKVNDQETIAEAFARVEAAGPDHPEYFSKFDKVMQAGMRASELKIDFEDYWEKTHGITDRQAGQAKEIATALKNAEGRVSQQAPGKGSPADPNEKARSKMPVSRESKVDAQLHKLLNSE